MLTLVPTPIGNLEDITRRAIRVLSEASLILTEDTRKAKFLLQHLGIDKPLRIFNKDNEHRQLESILDLLEKGSSICLISDAGTPGISDPGFLLVRACIARGIPTECLPGPVAFVPALVNSGIPCDRFIFEGFLPHKKGRLSRWKELAQADRTIVLYESPHRIEKFLEECETHLGGNRRICLAREISKKFEEYIRGTVSELRLLFKGGKDIKGEFAIIIEGAHDDDEHP